MISTLIWRAQGVRILIAGLLAYGGLALTGLRIWTCPFHSVVGIPCPGCGMTRAVSALLHGDFDGAWMLHPFSWIVTPALAIGAVLAFLPRRLRIPLVRTMSPWERWLMPGLWFSAALLGFWIYRLASGSFPATI